MPSVDVNWLLVLYGVIASMIVGSIWYTPAVFGNMWMKELGKKKEDMKGAPTAYLIMALASAVLTYVMIHVASYTGADTISDGLATGFWTWLGFSASVGAGRSIFHGESFKLF